MTALVRFLSHLFAARKFKGDGYVVRFAPTWTGFVYEEADKEIKIYAERMVDERGIHLAVYVKDSRDLRWEPPNDRHVISEDKARQIIRRLEVALARLAPAAELV
jgi:hypothetical protein